MRIARTLGSRPEAPTPVAALLCVFALLVQAFMPAAAMAAQAGTTDDTMVICTQMGVQVVKVGEAQAPQKGGFAGLPCANCLAATAAVVLSIPERIDAPVAYETARVEHVETAEVTLRGARAPPRPPGQGPPEPNA
ncbi:MAG: DUF2946 family protein [Phenylobacterium sp.]